MEPTEYVEEKVCTIGLDETEDKTWAFIKKHKKTIIYCSLAMLVGYKCGRKSLRRDIQKVKYDIYKNMCTRLLEYSAHLVFVADTNKNMAIPNEVLTNFKLTEPITITKF
jgi:tRNA uridine 5-carbamoylmethylation protein Kti12